MANTAAVATALAYLHELYPSRPITDATLAAFTEALACLSDTQVIDAAKRVGSERGRTFFPSAGEILGAVPPAPAPPTPDADSILQQIDGMGQYNPNAGWVRPSVERIRDRFGDDLAAAYAAEGPHRLYADNDTTRDIARAAFSKAITAAHHEAIRLGLPPAHKALSSGGAIHPDVRAVIANVARGMGA
jgi:hypothetical protein